jgi:peptide/nickel transport system permease protein
MASLDYERLEAWSKLLDLTRHLVLPVTALVLSALPAILMHAHTAVRDVLGTPFIRAARARGIGRWRVLYRHALPASANPLIALLGLSIGTLLSSSLLVEAMVGWPGLGRLLLDATLQRDYYVVAGVVMLCAIFLIGGNLIADLLLYAADPRIRRD